MLQRSIVMAIPSVRPPVRPSDIMTGLQNVFTSSSLRTSCRWSVWSRQSLHVATCARQVRVTWLCHGQKQLALVHEGFQSLVR